MINQAIVTIRHKMNLQLNKTITNKQGYMFVEFIIIVSHLNGSLALHKLCILIHR